MANTLRELKSTNEITEALLVVAYAQVTIAIDQISKKANDKPSAGPNGKYVWHYWDNSESNAIVKSHYNIAHSDVATLNQADNDEKKKAANEKHFNDGFPQKITQAKADLTAGKSEAFKSLGAYYALLFLGPGNGESTENPFEDIKLEQNSFPREVNAEQLKRLAANDPNEMIRIIGEFTTSKIKVDQDGLDPYMINALERYRSKEKSGRAVE